MANVFEQLWSPAHRVTLGGGAEAPREEDQAIGFECANPSLQLEGWEPAPLAPSAGHAPVAH
jgi:hypothetical protein